jgi:hypothetical protein
MSLSGYFGWVLGEGIALLGLFLAAMCAGVAFLVSAMFHRAAVYLNEGMWPGAVRCWAVGCLFLAANVVFDYSSASAVREQVTVAASNANTAADDVRTKIAGISKEIAARENEAAWRTELRSPQAYQAEIDRLEGDRVFTRSKSCGDASLPDSRDLCRQRAEAISHKSMAERRIQLLEEVKRLRAELVEAQKQSGETVHHANPALAQAKMLGSWFALNRNLSDAQLFWTQNGTMLIMALLVNLGLAYLGHELGSSRPAYREEPSTGHDHILGRNILTDQRPPDVRHNDPPPIPLRPAPSSANVTFITPSGKRGLDANDIDKLLAAAQEALDRAKRPA